MAVCFISEPLAKMSHSMMGSQMMESFMETMKAVGAPWCWTRLLDSKAHCLNLPALALDMEKRDTQCWPLVNLSLEPLKSRWVCTWSRLSQNHLSQARGLWPKSPDYHQWRGPWAILPPIWLPFDRVGETPSNWVYLRSKKFPGLLCRKMIQIIFHLSSYFLLVLLSPFTIIALEITPFSCWGVWGLKKTQGPSPLVCGYVQTTQGLANETQKNSGSSQDRP